jgi:hypothetical protein
MGQGKFDKDVEELSAIFRELNSEYKDATDTFYLWVVEFILEGSPPTKQKLGPWYNDIMSIRKDQRFRRLYNHYTRARDLIKERFPGESFWTSKSMTDRFKILYEAAFQPRQVGDLFENT